ncbi:TPA: polysaccharide pyruvyl transferase CsaB [Bacillus tropicus]|uniref:Polysaccharide pyruvyl transferase CsaB n=1 Tax=Bacillus tropicus TaxID=2026188 RepID=A0ABD7ZNB8_9BACI|nr:MULTISPECIES: polysaccharide pyruvyl transferase CsaB [Bacillus]AIY77552.1 polysaccharide pyruvyl transferase CsaB [Bacillus cereus]AJI04188.1 polysaccharide pyruvyl transferase CsaB [Bacillus cereus G9241]PED54054.1 polysaccharide pyruvyl transferase CsaB [Bacillus anthracis]AJG95825.1 polysaccharide pyruvyl transferase CsaB [Bacillus cereus]ARO16856.1 polysaccharide pyruvyl transferase CsaB [Bacillus cereus]
MRLVLSGYYGFYNVGDEAILQSIIKALHEEDPTLELVVLSNDPDYTRKMYGVEAVNRWDIRAIYKEIKRSNGLISGGGSLLQDKTSIKSILYYTGIMRIARFLKKPYYIYAQGIGPITKRQNRLLVKWQVSKAEYISVRDEDSFLYLKEIGIKKDIELVPDPVLACQPEGMKSKWLQKHSIQGKVIAVSVRYWDAKEDYMKKLADTLKKFKRDGYHILFVPMHGPFDQNASRDIINLMGEEAHMLPYKLDIHEKISILSECSLLIGMRLHALILSAVANIPMVGISYDPKIDSFLQQVNQPIIGNVDGDWTAETLYNVATKQLEQKEYLQATLEQRVEELREQISTASRYIINDLNSKEFKKRGMGS